MPYSPLQQFIPGLLNSNWTGLVFSVACEDTAKLGRFSVFHLRARIAAATGLCYTAEQLVHALCRTPHVVSLPSHLVAFRHTLVPYAYQPLAAARDAKAASN